MKIVTAILFLLSWYVVDAQVKVNEIKMKHGSEFHKAKDADVVYPVISSGNNEIDDKINYTLIKAVTGNDTITDISKTLFHAMNDGLSELSYKITLNTNDIFSLRLYTFICLAYCSAYYYYFNFDVHTGDLLKIEDVINKSDLDSFRTVVLKDKIKALRLDKKVYDSLLSVGKIDSVDYNWMLDIVQECSNEANIEKFILFKNELQITDECAFPHAITGLQPVYELKYSYKKIRKSLNRSFLEKLKTTAH